MSWYVRLNAAGVAVALIGALVGCVSAESPAADQTRNGPSGHRGSGGSIANHAIADNPDAGRAATQHPADATRPRARPRVTKLMVFVVENHSMQQMRRQMP